jgi:hypothetical protein
MLEFVWCNFRVLLGWERTELISRPSTSKMHARMGGRPDFGLVVILLPIEFFWGICGVKRDAKDDR